MCHPPRGNLQLLLIETVRFADPAGWNAEGFLHFLDSSVESVFHNPAEIRVPSVDKRRKKTERNEISLKETLAHCLQKREIIPNIEAPN